VSVLPGRGRLRRTASVIGALLLCSGLVAASAAASQAAMPQTKQAKHATAKDASAFPDVIVQRDQAHAGATFPATGAAPAAYGPSDLRSAYNLVSAAASGGKGATVAIVGAFDDPSAASDLAAYRSTYKLPACTKASGCFKEVNENGQSNPLPTGNDNGGAMWAQADAIGVDMVSAVCPNCHILLVEASDVQASDMGAAVDSAVKLGARYVIVGWSLEGMYSAAVDKTLDHPGVAIVAAAGDRGYYPFCCFGEASYPADSQYVISVGGTTLTRASNARGWSETVWGPPSSANDYLATASGCVNAFYGKPSWQTDAGCAGRTQNDVSAVADPNTGVAFYNTAYGDRGWDWGGGTAVSAAIVASVYALAGTPAAGSYPASYPYLHAADLYPVTSGNDAGGPCTPAYLCTAGPGYNGPAGWGTPDGTAAFTAGTKDAVTMIDPWEQYAGLLPETASVQVEAQDSAGNPLTYSATGLPPGVSIDPATGLISGTVSSYYHGTVSVTASDADGATATVSFSWLAEDRMELSANSVRQSQPGVAVTLPMKAIDANKSLPITYTATGLPPGLGIDSSAGTISGSPSVIGTYTVTVTASDPTGSSASVTFTWHVWNTITVTVPAITNQTEQSFVQVAITPIGVTATDSTADQTLTYSATGLPLGLSIDPSTGSISGTPTTLGEYSVTVTATDGTGSQGSAWTSWVVVGKITIASPGNQTTDAGQTVQLPFRVTDTAADDSVNYFVTGGPPGLNIGWNTATIVGWPTTPGRYKTTVTAEGLLGSIASASFTWTVRPAPTVGPTGPVRLDLGGKCLDDAGDRTAYRTKVQIWTCNGDAAQRWTFVADGTLRIHGKCLDVSGNGTAIGAKLQIASCTGAANQTWSVGTGAELVSAGSPFCLADPGASTKNGTWVELGRCLAGARDAWTLPAGPIESGIRDKCIAVEGGRTGNGTKIVLWTCDGSKAQQWTAEPDGTIRNFGKCLTIQSISGYGRPAVLWSCGAEYLQQKQWTIPLSGTPGSEIWDPAGEALSIPAGKTGNGTVLVTGNPGDPYSVWNIG
jgi:hypothetical protein